MTQQHICLNIFEAIAENFLLSNSFFKKKLIANVRVKIMQFAMGIWI